MCLLFSVRLCYSSTLLSLPVKLHYVYINCERQVWGHSKPDRWHNSNSTGGVENNLEKQENIMPVF